jgi:hypothetical protein
MAATPSPTRIETKVYAGPGLNFEVRKVMDLDPAGGHTGRTFDLVVQEGGAGIVEVFLTPSQLEALGDVIRAASGGRRQS